MFSGLTRIVASSGPIVHTSADPLFKIHGATITNSMLYGWICAIVMIIVLITVALKVRVKPRGGLIQYVEAAADFMTNVVTGSFEDKARGRKYVPYFVTLFFFILINNWMGLIPGVGEGIVYNGQPLLRPFTGDINATFAAGVVTMVYVYVNSIREVGVKHYFAHFFVGNPKNPLYIFIGALEMLLDLTRVISLSIRLFLNVTIGEIVIVVFAYLGGVVAPITSAPFYALEIFVGALQAYIFVVLSVNYLAISVNSSTEHEDLTEDIVPETISLQTE
jgi:F-type H+-transporting ATPase subunit a